MREYMKKRREDPEFAEKVRKTNRESKKKRMQNPEMVQRNREQQNERYRKMRDAYKNSCK